MFDVDITIHFYKKSETGIFIKDIVFKAKPKELLADDIELDNWLNMVRKEILKMYRKNNI